MKPSRAAKPSSSRCNGGSGVSRSLSSSAVSESRRPATERGLSATEVHPENQATHSCRPIRPPATHQPIRFAKHSKQPSYTSKQHPGIAQNQGGNHSTNNCHSQAPLLCASHRSDPTPVQYPYHRICCAAERSLCRHVRKCTSQATARALEWARQPEPCHCDSWARVRIVPIFITHTAFEERVRYCRCLCKRAAATELPTGGSGSA